MIHSYLVCVCVQCRRPFLTKRKLLEDLTYAPVGNTNPFQFKIGWAAKWLLLGASSLKTNSTIKNRRGVFVAKSCPPSPGQNKTGPLTDFSPTWSQAPPKPSTQTLPFNPNDSPLYIITMAFLLQCFHDISIFHPTDLGTSGADH